MLRHAKCAMSTSVGVGSAAFGTDTRGAFEHDFLAKISRMAVWLGLYRRQGLSRFPSGCRALRGDGVCCVDPDRLSDRTPSSDRLRYAAVISGVVLIAGVILAKRKLVIIGAIAAIVGFRALIAAILGFWQGFPIAVAALFVFIFCARESDIE